MILEKIVGNIRPFPHTAKEILKEYLFSRDPLIPPRHIRALFGATIPIYEYKKIGDIFFNIFTQRCNVKADDKILEIGSGCGRIAFPLTQYLSPDGSYEGLEIQKCGYDWCRNNITPRYPQFHFTYADIYNKEYNPHGAEKASEYRFPYPAEHFNFIYMTSVFTHMLPHDMIHYLEEVFRMLRPDGRCLITFFLWNQDSEKLHNSSKSVFNFAYDYGPYLTIDRIIPELAVAYREEFIRAKLEKTGFKLISAPLYGHWSGRTGSITGQDVYILSK